MPRENEQSTIGKKLYNFLSHAGTVYLMFAAVIGSLYGFFTAYQNFLKAINENQEQIEFTQIMILKPLVRNFEKNACPISDAEWDEYLMNGSTLQELKQKHKLISKDIPFVPVKRIRERTDKCKD